MNLHHLLRAVVALGRRRRVRPGLPPIWRIRKIGSHWTVLRISPIRHEIYFPVAKVATYEDALKWVCVRTGVCSGDLPDYKDGPSF